MLLEHTGEKPYKSSCKPLFRQYVELNEHIGDNFEGESAAVFIMIFRHTGDQPYRTSIFSVRQITQ